MTYQMQLDASSTKISPIYSSPGKALALSHFDIHKVLYEHIKLIAVNIKDKAGNPLLRSFVEEEDILHEDSN